MKYKKLKNKKKRDHGWKCTKWEEENEIQRFDEEIIKGHHGLNNNKNDEDYNGYQNRLNCQNEKEIY